LPFRLTVAHGIAVYLGDRVIVDYSADAEVLKLIGTEIDLGFTFLRTAAIAGRKAREPE
jgi:hypothetical protein